MAARTFELSAAAPESAASGDGAADAEPAADSKAFSPVRDLPDVIINGDRGSALLPAALALETAAAASEASPTGATRREQRALGAEAALGLLDCGPDR